MPSAPFVELLVPDLAPSAITQIGTRHLGDPGDLISSALMAQRLLMVNYIKRELAKGGEVTGERLLALLNTAGQLYLGRFNSVVGPVAVNAYVRAFRSANSGDVPMSMIYALAEDHAERMGRYFNESSKEALVGGFNTYVNRQLPARVAADRALEAYGMTPRQMSGYTSLEPAGKIASRQTRSLKARATEYISRSLRQRVKIFAKQEVHNLDLQANQTAWSWMQAHGKISEAAEKVWLTEKDERTCKVCGPMHGKRAGVVEKFSLPNGMEVWTAGVHPNCRCEVRLLDPLALVSKADDGDKWFNDEYKRDRSGRFSGNYSAADRAMATAPTQEAPQEEPPEVKTTKRNQVDQTQFRRLVAEEMLRRKMAERPRTEFKDFAQGLKLTPVEPRTETARLSPVERKAEPEVKLAPVEVVAPTAAISIDQPFSAKEITLPWEAQEGQQEHLDAFDPEALFLDVQAARAERESAKMVRPLMETHYAIVEGSDDSAHYQLRDQNFQPNFQAALNTALMRKNGAIQDDYDMYTDFGTLHPRINVPGQHGVLKGIIDQRDLKRVLNHVAFMSTSRREDDTGDHFVQIPLYDIDEDAEPAWDGDEDEVIGYPVGSVKMTLDELASELGVEPSNYEVKILAVEEVHHEAGARGTSQYVDDNLVIAGDYEADSEKYEPAMSDRGVGIDVVTIKPFDPAYGAIPADDD